jgi:uncharacterized protein YecE (DUF72 family)
MIKMTLINSSNIYIGTSGWSYPRGEGTWRGYFYPDARINELEYYSHFFRTVEMNSSFYHPPDPRLVNRWIYQVPHDFLFSVKLWQKFTHPKMFKEVTGQDTVVTRGDADIFLKSIEPLIRTGKLGLLLAQFPPSFKNDKQGQQTLSSIVKLFGHLRLAIELRDRSWSDTTDTAELFAKHNVTWAQVDEPKFRTSIAKSIPLTGNVAYFRFHGRNVEQWWTGNNETRYKYLYSLKEIQELAEKVISISEKTNLTFVYFNNHWQGYAPRNAIDLMKALQLPFKDIPLRTDTGNKHIQE